MGCCDRYCAFFSDVLASQMICGNGNLSADACFAAKHESTHDASIHTHTHTHQKQACRMHVFLYVDKGSDGNFSRSSCPSLLSIAPPLSNERERIVVVIAHSGLNFLLVLDRLVRRGGQTERL